jgi:hypothetical protein
MAEKQRGAMLVLIEQFVSIVDCSFLRHRPPVHTIYSFQLNRTIKIFTERSKQDGKKNPHFAGFGGKCLGTPFRRD